MHLITVHPLGLSAALAAFSLFFTHPAAAENYTLSLHDALPISGHGRITPCSPTGSRSTSRRRTPWRFSSGSDRKSTRLNSSHLGISYAVFCLKKKKRNKQRKQPNSEQKHRIAVDWHCLSTAEEN